MNRKRKECIGYKHITLGEALVMGKGVESVESLYCHPRAHQLVGAHLSSMT